MKIFPKKGVQALSLALSLCACTNDNDPAFTAAVESPAPLPATTRFERLSAQKTGISFAQSMKESFSFNFLDDPYVYNGGGVAVLDIDNDGLQDLFFISRQMECKLYRNKGNLEFEDLTARGNVSCKNGLKTGVSVVDINADGWQDLYVCRTGIKPNPDRTNLLFVNNGKDASGAWSGFTEKAQEYGLADISASQHANFFDFDLDGDLDVYILNQPVDQANTQTIDFNPAGGKTARMQAPRLEHDTDRLLRNDNGKFTDISREAGIWNRAWGLSVTVSDISGDGYPDVYVGNDFVMPDFFYINNRNGTFSDQTESWFRHLSQHTMGVDIADLNNDALPDIVALDMLAESWERRKRLQTTMLNQRYNLMVSKTYGHQLMRNTLQINNGNGTFSDIACLAGIDATDWSWATFAADFDNDGWKDIFISNGIRRDVNDQDFFSYSVDSINKIGGIGPKTFKTYEDFANILSSQKVHNYMYKNLNGLEYADVSEAWGFTDLKFSNGAAYVDLDNDGDLDIVCNNVEEPAAVYLNKAEQNNTNNWLQIRCKGSSQNPTGTGAKIWVYANGQVQYQEMTPVRGFFSSVEPVFQAGLGAAASADRVEIEWQEGKHQILENVPAKQRLTFNISDAKPGRLPQRVGLMAPLFAEHTTSGLDFEHRENVFEDFDREKLIPHRLSTQGPALAVTDVDNNGLDDVFVGGASGQEAALFLQTAAGKFARSNQPAIANDARCEDVAAVFLDADTDGDPDLFVVSGGNELNTGDPAYGDRLYFNDGKGIFSVVPNAFPKETDSGGCALVYDYDTDGDPDLLVGSRLIPGEYPRAGASCIYRNDKGVFTEVGAEIAPDFRSLGMVTDLLAADLNGNGQPELIVCGEWMAIEVFEYQSGKFVRNTAAYGLDKSSGWWNCLAATDLDGDGDLDLVAGNEGRNTRFKPTPGAPLRMFARDFDKNGKIDPILSVAVAGYYYPAAYRDLLVSQVTPAAVKKKYPRNRSYATAKVQDVFPAGDLKSGMILEAGTFSTSWWENDKGVFKVHALPVEAQVAPVEDILCGDFNGDGKTDILLVGNNFGPHVETGRLDASNGCLLLGDGKGGFNFLPGRHSGFWAMREARRMAFVGAGDGQNLAVVANSNSRAQVFNCLNFD